MSSSTRCCITPTRRPPRSPRRRGCSLRAATCWWSISPPTSREEFRATDAHIRLGFDNSAMEGWFAAAGLSVDYVQHLKGGELTVTLWRGAKSPVRQRRAA